MHALRVYRKGFLLHIKRRNLRLHSNFASVYWAVDEIAMHERAQGSCLSSPFSLNGG